MKSFRRVIEDIEEIIEGKRPEQGIQEALDYANSIIETIREPLLVLDADLRIVTANRAFYVAFNLTPQLSENRLIYELGNRQWDIPALRELLEEILPKNTAFNDFEVDYEFPDIGRRVLLLNARRIYSAGQRTQRILLTIEDITERKKLEQLKDEFIGMVSHELSRPLTIITGSLNTVLDESTILSEQERIHLLRNSALQADALTHLLGNLLELARIQAERLILHAEPIGVSVIAKNVVERISEQYPGHEFSLDFPMELPRLNADPIRLERILYNLVDNGRKYSPEGTEVKISAKTDGDYLVIAVSDQGVGIATSDYEKIFGAFERLENIGYKHSKGIGLGLLVCRRLVEAHGGKIWVESEPEKGSTFFFTIPCLHEA